MLRVAVAASVVSVEEVASAALVATFPEAFAAAPLAASATITASPSTIITILAAAIVVPLAAGGHIDGGNYSTRFLSPNEGANSRWDDGCTYIFQSAMQKEHGGVYGTVTFINANGYGWHATVRSLSQYVISDLTTQQAQSFTKLAHCVNSGGYTYWANCAMYYLLPHGSCA